MKTTLIIDERKKTVLIKRNRRQKLLTMGPESMEWLLKGITLCLLPR